MNIDNLKVSERGSNYFVLSDDDCLRLYSYDSLIAIKFYDGKTFLDNCLPLLLLNVIIIDG